MRRIVLIATLWFTVVGVTATSGAGPDVIVGDLFGTTRWGTVGGITAYSVGTNSCNVGTAPLLWVGSTNQHPVIAQNMYRLKDGRFEQIGMAWLKHGFASLNESGLCGTCVDPGSSQLLGVGCNDPYNSGLNGNQFVLGPRSEVNAATGAFPYPFTFYPMIPTIGFRLQVQNDDVNPALNAGALYFVEGHYIAADDAAAGNALNNASYRRVLVNEPSPGVYALTLTGITERTKPAIVAWQDSDPSVTLTNVDIPGDGRLILGVKVTDLGNYFWQYEYALFNLNSHRSVGMLTFAISDHAAVPVTGFHDVNYHSGELIDGTDWPASRIAGGLRWQTTPHAVNPQANALRFSTLYNFRFVANSPPVANAQIEIGLFRPGAPASVIATMWGPLPDPPDCNGNSIPDHLEIQADPSLDCDGNGNLDECDLDCDGNGIPDACDIANDAQLDCNANGRLDVCEIEAGGPAPGGPYFCVADCDPDCNANGVPDACDISSGFSEDCNANGVPDECDIAANTSNDCNGNGIPDECEISVGSPAPGGPFFCTSGCEADCNVNGIPDSCDINGGADSDCNGNQVPDSCDIASNPSLDCNGNGLIDTCAGEIDCNNNGIPDGCEYPACPGILVGDLDCSGLVDLDDVPLFVEAMLADDYTCQADTNHDGKLDGLDVQGFVDAM